jgi:hypothetical protein
MKKADHNQVHDHVHVSVDVGEVVHVLLAALDVRHG